MILKEILCQTNSKIVKPSIVQCLSYFGHHDTNPVLTKNITLNRIDAIYTEHAEYTMVSKKVTE